MFEQEIRVTTAEGEMTAFVSHPDEDGPFSVAVVYMDGPGYREQLKENARRFAAGGFYCVAPDLFHRAGEKLSFDLSRDRDEMRRALLTVTPDGVDTDTEALFAAIEDDPAAAKGPKVCVGYCRGARCVVHVMASMPDEFAAGAAIHPAALYGEESDSPHRELATVRGELYVSFAENDHSATAENVDQFRNEFERNGVRGEVERVPGVTHGFAMADLAVYDRDAAERHFVRTLDLWRRNLLAQRPPA